MYWSRMEFRTPITVTTDRIIGLPRRKEEIRTKEITNDSPKERKVSRLLKLSRGWENGSFPSKQSFEYKLRVLEKNQL